MAEIVLKNITKSFGDRKLFDGFSLTIEPGEYVSIMGESGSGKTTLLNMIGLLDTPDSGDITICGCHNLKFNSKKMRALRRSKISYLFQNYGLIENETVEYNLAISAHFKNLKPKDKKHLYKDALQKVGLDGYEKRIVYTLSGGEQQRVALAKIIVKSPQIILADEPTGSLDAQNRDYVLRILSELNSEGKTIVVVTHDPVVGQCAKSHIRL